MEIITFAIVCSLTYIVTVVLAVTMVREIVERYFRWRTRIYIRKRIKRYFLLSEPDILLVGGNFTEGTNRIVRW